MDDANTTKHKCYIASPTGRIAIYTQTYDKHTFGTTYDTKYLHKDHLGSVDVITDSTGAVLERDSFDAWGFRRTTDWQAQRPIGSTSIVSRGFTDHEELDSLGLVNMNGRIYDPGIGRFLSADPFVQFPFKTQNFNRYTYVLNNPLKFTDPSGFSIWDGVFAVFKFGIDLVRWATGHLSTNAFIASFCTTVAYLTLSTIPYVGPFIATLGAGFTSSFMSTILSGASLGQAVEAGTIGATIAAATYGLFRYGLPTVANALNPGTTAATSSAQVNMAGTFAFTSGQNITVASVTEAVAQRVVVTGSLNGPTQVDIIQEVARDIGSGAGAAVTLSLADKIRNLLGIGPQSKSYLPRTRLPDSAFRGGNRLNEVKLKDVLDYGPIRQLVAYNNLHPEEALSMTRFADGMVYGIAYPAAGAVALPVLPLYAEAIGALGRGATGLYYQGANAYLTNPVWWNEFAEVVAPGSLMPSTISTTGPAAGAITSVGLDHAWDWYWNWTGTPH